MTVESERKWTPKEVDVNEYELLRGILSLLDYEVENPIDRSMIERITRNISYQRCAIEIITDCFGNKTLRGIIGTRIILYNYSIISQDILDTLLQNILYSYQDEAEKVPIALIGDYLNEPYLKSILSQRNLKLKQNFQEKIAELVIESMKQNYDFQLIMLFILNSNIAKKIKMKVIDQIDEGYLYQFKCQWENEVMFNVFQECCHGDVLNYEEYNDYDVDLHEIIGYILNKIEG